MIAKVARRMLKLKQYLTTASSFAGQSLSSFIVKNFELISNLIGHVRASLSRSWDKLIRDESEGSIYDVRLSYQEVTKDIEHSIEPVNEFIRKTRQISSVQSTRTGPVIEEDDKLLHEHFLYEVESYDPNTLSQLDNTKLLDMLMKYIDKAKSFYENDPLGGSRMILTSLKILMVMDMRASENFPLLRNFHSGIQINIIENLVLPSKSTLCLGRQMESYFHSRNECSRFPSLIDEDHISGNHGRSQDFFFGGGHLFKKIFKKYSKNFVKNFVKFFKKLAKN